MVNKKNIRHILIFTFISVLIFFQFFYKKTYFDFCINNNSFNQYKAKISKGGKHNIEFLKKYLYYQLNSSDHEIRRNVSEVLGEIEGKNNIKILWNVFLKDENITVKSAALTGLGLTGEKKASKYLAKALSHKNAALRREAALNCGDLGDKTLLNELSKAFNQEENIFNKVAIGASMATLGSKEKTIFLEDIALNNNRLELREYAAKLLACHVNDLPNNIVKKDIINEKEERIKIWLICSLAQRDNSMIDVLKNEAKNNKNILFKQAYIHCLCEKIKDHEFVYPLLIQLLKEEDPCVRENTVEDLADIRTPEIVTLLGNVLLNDKNFIVREVAAWGLGKIGDVRGLYYLEKAFYDENPFVQTGAVAAVYKILTLNKNR